MTSFVDRAAAGWRLPLALLVLGLLVFASITVLVLAGDAGLIELNYGLYHSLQTLRSADWDTLMRVITALGDAAVSAPVALAALAWMLWLRDWRTAGFWALATAGGTLLVGLIKNLTQVTRPQDLYTGLSNFSFPSGHATMSLVVYGLLAYFISRGMSAGRRWSVMLVAALLIGSIGFSRLYLGAHWLSDVLGGYALALAWIAALVLAWAYGNQQPRRLSGLLPVVLIVLLLATAWHVFSGADVARERYQPAQSAASAAVHSTADSNNGLAC